MEIAPCENSVTGICPKEKLSALGFADGVDLLGEDPSALGFVF